MNNLAIHSLRLAGTVSVDNVAGKMRNHLQKAVSVTKCVES